MPSALKQEAVKRAKARKAAEGSALGARIKQARWLRDWTQRDVAQRIECDPTQVSHWETGYYVPSTASLRKLSQVLRVSIDWLLGDSSAEPGR